MFDNHPNHEFCETTGGNNPADTEESTVNPLAEKSMEHEVNTVENGEAEATTDAIVNPLQVDDDWSSVKSLRAVQLISAATKQTEVDDTNNVSKPTEFVIISAVSGAETVRFPDDACIKNELNGEEALENDPMDLLELNERSEGSSSRSNVELDDGGDDISSTCSSSVQTTNSSTTVNISEWSKDYPWLLHEESDEWYGYCLYCDVKLSVRSYKSVKHHGISLYHRERCEHYLAFQEEEDKNNLGASVADIKHEFGTDSYVAALKLKRKTQAEAFNNYNWRRWLDECPWLERESQPGTIGMCKYCNIRLNVEFSYLRRRHQESGQHKEKEKLYAKQDESKPDKEDETDEKDLETNENEDIEPDDDTNGNEEQSDELWYLERENNKYARCILCDTDLMKMSSFKRHTRTQLHICNAKNGPLVTLMKAKKLGKFLQTEQENAVSNNWKLYSSTHSWLVADPTDSMYAYCKYCKKRLSYGHSAAKRALHEQSNVHKAQEKVFKESQERSENDNIAPGKTENQSTIDAADEDGDDEEEDAEDEEASEEENKQEEEADSNSDELEQENEAEEGDDNTDEEEDEDEECEEEEDDKDNDDKDHDDTEESNDDDDKSVNGDSGKTKKRFLSSMSEWYDQYPWCKRYKKDTRYFFCSYCKTSITKPSRTKHMYTKRHIEAEEIVLKRKEKANAREKSKQEEHYPWAADIKGHTNLYYCKCCRVRISRHYSKKQHSISKIHQINEKLYQNKKYNIIPQPEAKPAPTATSTQQSIQKQSGTPALRKVVKAPSFISSIKLWQKRHTWLGYKLTELRSNYAYCKACEQSLYVRSLKNVVKHQRSSKHLRIVNQLRRERRMGSTNINSSQAGTTAKQEDEQKESATPVAASLMHQEENAEDLNTSNKGNQNKPSVDVETLQKRYSWITKTTRADHVYCRYCNMDVPLSIIFLRNHTNSRSHRRSVVNFVEEMAKKEKDQQDESNAADNGAEDDDEEDDEDVVLLEDNTEEILISEQDDNWTVKSENMDEHEALDCLLQRAGKNAHTSNKASTARDERKKTTTADERPSKRFKRSHSFRKLNESTNSSIISSILSTPLTLASCLGPLIQQQIQQVTNSQHSPSTSAAAAATQESKGPENTYDLFFKSMSETMKKLPIDLAAEGKMKVMQIICDLELRALKRQQQEEQCILARQQSMEQSNNVNLISSSLVNNSNFDITESYIANSTNTFLNGMTNTSAILNPTSGSFEEQSNVGNTSTANGERNITTPSAADQNVRDTVATSMCESATSLSPNTGQQRPQQQHQPPHASVSNVSYPTYTTSTPASTTTKATADKSKIPSQAPIIGVMDMNGLQTLQLRNSQSVVKQMPIQSVTNNSGVSTSIRCIPFKNLTQNRSVDGTPKFRSIQMPSTSTPTSQHVSAHKNTASISTAPKSLVNLRSINITKRTLNTPPQQTQTSPPSSISVVNQNTDKAQPGTYVQAPHVQRWTTVNGSMNSVPNKRATQPATSTTSAVYFQVSAKQHNYSSNFRPQK